MGKIGSKREMVAFRLAASMVWLGLGLLALTFAVLVPIQMQSLRARTINQAHTLAEAIATLYQAVDREQEMHEASRLIIQVARMRHVAFINLMDRSGKVIYSTEKDETGHLHSPLEGREEIDNLLYVTHVVSQSHSSVSAVSVVMELSGIYVEYIEFYIELAVAFILAIIFLALFIRYMTKRVVGDRLANLASVMGSAESGSFLVRAPVDIMDEVGAVSIAFNKLLSAMTHMQVKEIEREQDLKTVQDKLSIQNELERVAQELRRSNGSLNRRVKAQELLMDAAHHLGGVLNKNALLNRLVTLVRDKLGWPDFAIFLVSTETNTEPILRLATASGLPNIDLIRELTFKLGEGITGLVAQTAVPMAIGNLATENRLKLWDFIENNQEIPEFLRQGSMLSVPISYQGRVVGVMDFFYPEINAFDEEDVALLHALGALVATSIINADLYEATLQLATSDALTGVLNRRAMERIMESEVARAQRFSTPLSFLLVDVDYFKNYNDRMGHVMGDVALKEIAACLGASVRKVDSVARFGGEEFCVILPQTQEAAALEVAQKLCAAIRKLPIKGANKQPLGHLSISVGVAVYPKHMPPNLEQTPQLELIHAADEALYAAKRQGRDRVVCFSHIFSAEKKS